MGARLLCSPVCIRLLRGSCKEACFVGHHRLWLCSLVLFQTTQSSCRRCKRECSCLEVVVLFIPFFFVPSKVCVSHPEQRQKPSMWVMKVSRKEVFQPHLPVRLPCYDLAPITGITLGRPLRLRPSGAPGFHGLTGGVYKARERIHRAMADARLLANPASRSRVADSGPNWERLLGLASTRVVATLCTVHCNTCVAPDVRAVLI